MERVADDPGVSSADSASLRSRPAVESADLRSGSAVESAGLRSGSAVESAALQAGPAVESAGLRSGSAVESAGLRGAVGLRVREVLAAPCLADARVLAGAEGLDRIVQRLNVMEVPDILPWVKPHELLLTTGYPLRDDPDALVALVGELDERGLAALAIKKDAMTSLRNLKALVESKTA